MSTSIQGGCACGAIRYECSSEPLMAVHCQCRQCQRDSGTGHASHMAFPEQALRVTGEPTFFEQKADSGNIVARGFCSTCGSPVLSRNSGMTDMLFVRGGSLDDPSLFKPQMVVWASAGQPWDHMDPALPSAETMPPSSEMP